MYYYYIIEIQKAVDGTYAHLVHTAYDAEADVARQKAESTYHQVLSYAAISQLPMHSASLMAPDGTPIMHQCYTHTIVTPES